MTRKTKLSYTECKVELKLFTDAAYDRFKSHAYAAGYYETMLAEVLASMPKDAQERFITQIRKSLPMVLAK